MTEPDLRRCNPGKGGYRSAAYGRQEPQDCLEHTFEAVGCALGRTSIKTPTVARRTRSAQLRSKVRAAQREAERELKRRVDAYNREVERVNRENRRRVENHNRKVEQHNRRAVDAFLHRVDFSDDELQVALAYERQPAA